MTKRILGLVLTAVGLAGCEGVIGANGQAEVEVLMAGGSEAASDTRYFSEEPASSTAQSSARGDLDVKARVYLRSANGEWVEVTRGAVEKRMSIESAGSSETFTSGSVREGSYDRVRIEFERVQAHLDGEMHLGLGILSGSVRVQGTDGDRIVVERPTSVDASNETRRRLKVFLNSDTWLRHANTESRVVLESAFRNAVEVDGE
jgi:hypothetical protein